MRLIRGLVGAIILLGFFGGGALAESFDIFEYTTPQGLFGSIVLYASVPASNNPQQNFQGE